MNNSSDTCFIYPETELQNHEVCSINEFKSFEKDRINHQLPCYNMSAFNHSEFSSVILMNSTQLLTHLTSHSSGMCAIVLFYAVWCPFSMQLASSYNALGHILVGVPVIAVEVVSQVNPFSSSQLRFGPVSVPNIIVFHGTRTIGKYNESNKNVENLLSFIRRFMDVGFVEINSTYDNISTNFDFSHFDKYGLSSDDYRSPVPIELQQQTDWLLILSSIFLLFVLFFKVGLRK